MADFIDPSKIEEFKLLQLEGKRLASVGDLKASLKKFELAKQICATPKVLQRIEKLKTCLGIDYSEKDQPIVHLSSTSSPLTEVKVETPLSSTDGNKLDLKICNSIKKESKVLSDIQNIQSIQKPVEKKSELSDLSPQSQVKFKQLKNEAKEFAYVGKYHEAVSCFKRALGICDCPKVKRYIKEIEALILTNSNQVNKSQDQSPEKNHASDSAQESPHSVKKSSANNSTYVQSDVTKVITKNKDEFIEKRGSSESNGQKSRLSNSNNESSIERKLDEVKIIYEEARILAADGKLTDALKLLMTAQTIHETQKVQKRIDKLQELIAADLKDVDESKMIEVTKGFSVYHEIYNKLYPYQREGIAWMWKLYKTGKGGVLGDDMGLGKTFQVIAFISGMIDSDLLKHVLIIMPVSLLKNWEREFKKWCPGIAVYDFHSGSKKERERNKLRVQRRGHVLLTSYGMIVNNVKLLTEMEGSEFVWDYVILDEGHKIKNPTKTTKAVYEIPAKNRLVLTGTPIQNNLKELWSLYDFVHQGTLLGSLKTFKLQYENPISRSREKDATMGEKRLGLQMADNLKAVIKPYFLRRTKDEIWGKKDDIKDLETQMENMKITQLTAKKNDLILWTYMSEPQIAIYQDFLHSDAVKSILVSKRSPLVELTTLKKICDHPRLLSQRACFHLGLNGELQHKDELDLNDESTLASSIDNVTDDILLKESGKLKLVIDLLEHLKQTGHRTLVFSLSRKILDMIHRILVNRNWKVMRLDGTVLKTTDREKRILKFQNDDSYSVFLLTTQVGGVGITLTAADRVIIYDPSWNPATDAQAVDRAYRIGQERDVVVYRLITCGTVEEKIYRRQIFKDSITRQATGVTDPFRYFSKQELRELFSLDDPLYSATQVQLHEMHSSQLSPSDELKRHREFLSQLNIFGISDHDLMFTKEVEDHTEDNDPNAVSEHFIQQKVAAAHAQIQMEASMVAEGIRLAGTYNRPYQETIPTFKKNSAKDSYKPPVLPYVVDLTETPQEPFTLQDTVDDDIQIISSKSINESSLEQSSTVESRKEDAYPKSNVLHIATSHGDLNCKNYLGSEDAVDYVDIVEKYNKSLNESTNSMNEKLHKSSYSKPFIEDKSNTELLENLKKEDINLEETRSVDINKMSINENCDSKALDVTCDLKEKFQANLTHYMNDDIADFSFDKEEPAMSVKKGRKSCARQSTLLISESDTSCSTSHSNMSLNLVDESEEVDSDSDDSSNSASISFVPNSVTNTPQTPKCNAKLAGNIERITPLKVDKIRVRADSSFVQAMANSIEISPESFPKNKQAHDEINMSIDEEDNSPMKVVKKKVRQIHSDSDESDADSYTESRDYSRVENKQSYQKHLESLSVEKEYSNSENDNYKKQHDEVRILSDSFRKKQEQPENDLNIGEQQNKNVLSDHSGEVEDHFENSYKKDEQNEVEISSGDLNKKDSHSINSGIVKKRNAVLSNHSNLDASLSESSIDSESGDDDDLEQTYATCKGKTESNSDDMSNEEDNNPLKVNKNTVRQIHSDSDKSDTDSYAKDGEYSRINNKRRCQKRSKSLSVKDISHSENDDDEKQQNKSKVISNYSSREQSFSENDKNGEQDVVEISSDDSDKERSHSVNNISVEEQNVVLSNHSNSEASLSETYSNSESEEEDLEQTFATCKGKTESNSEDDISSDEDSEDYNSSESGSLFSEDD